MEGLIMAAQLLLGLSLLVAVHEFGHFITAKLFKMRVNKFYIFFDAWDKKIWSKKIGETEYGIGWLPLGGYVQIAGMIDETQDAKDLSSEPEEWEFRSKPAWQRFIVMIGGIVMNVLTGILIFAMFLNVFVKDYIPVSEVNKDGVYAYKAARDIGIEHGDKVIAVNGQTPERFKEIQSTGVFLGGELTIDRKGEIKNIQTPPEFFKRMNEGPLFGLMNETVKVGAVSDTMPAKAAGLQQGDEFLRIASTPIVRFADVSEVLKENKGGEVDLLVKRNGQEVALHSKVTDSGTLGFVADVSNNYQTKAYNWANGFKYGSLDGYELIKAQVISFGMLFTGKIDPVESISSPVGIARIYGGQWDWARFWRITGLLSFILAFMNILPIPALDGGHMVFLSYEMITGRKLSDAFLEKAQIIGFLLIMGLMIFALGSDIYKLFR